MIFKAALAQSALSRTPLLLLHGQNFPVYIVKCSPLQTPAHRQQTCLLWKVCTESEKEFKSIVYNGCYFVMQINFLNTQRGNKGQYFRKSFVPDIRRFQDHTCHYARDTDMAHRYLKQDLVFCQLMWKRVYENLGNMPARKYV